MSVPVTTVTTNPSPAASGTTTVLDDALIRDFRCGLVIPTPTENTGVNSFSFHHEGRFLLTSQGDSTIRLYNCVNGTYSKSIRVPKADPGIVRFTHHVSAAVLASTRSDEWERGLRYLSLYDNRDLRYFRGHTDVITSVELCPFEDTFVTASLDRTVRLWDLRTFKCQGKLTTPERPLAVYDPEGLVLAIATSHFNGSMVKLYDRRRIEAGPFLSIDVNKLLTPFTAANAFDDTGSGDELDEGPDNDADTRSNSALGPSGSESTTTQEQAEDDRIRRRRTRGVLRDQASSSTRGIDTSDAATVDASVLQDNSELARRSKLAMERESERKQAIASASDATMTAENSSAVSAQNSQQSQVTEERELAKKNPPPNYVGFLSQSIGFSADGTKFFISGVVRAPMVVQNGSESPTVCWAYRGKAFLLDAFTGTKLHELSVPVMMKPLAPGSCPQSSSIPKCLAAMSPDGNYITVSSSLGCLRTFNASTGEHITTNLHKPAAAALHARGGFDDGGRHASQTMCPIQNLAWNPVYSVLAASDPTQLALWIPKGQD